jgi:hypothetical protein
VARGSTAAHLCVRNVLVVRVSCVCGHWLHSLECFCGCRDFTEDDGTDGPSTAPGPHYNSDKYEGQYGTNRRYSK